MENEELITIFDEEGNETLFEILFTFALEEYKKEYVCVIPVGSEEEETDEDDIPDIYVFSYVSDETGEAGNLEEVIDEKEWSACEEVVNSVLDAEELEGDEE